MSKSRKTIFPIQPTLTLTAENCRTVDRNNCYFEFIERCKKKSYPPGTRFHRHHVIPQYLFPKGTRTPEQIAFLEDPSNIVRITFQEHAIAHYLLYKVYGRDEDLTAFYVLRDYENKGRSYLRYLGAKASHKVQKEKGVSFWSSAQQKVNAARSLAREDAIEIRSEAGRKGGIKAKANIAINASQAFEFSFEDKPVLCILNCTSGQQVVEELQKFKQTNIKRATPLLDGSRKKAFGWSCKEIDLSKNQEDE